MKIDRLIGILSVLLQQERTTAPELAEKFEVSRRTINRDIEDLCMAGIPIQTAQGVGGGISIMEGYSMDRTLLTSKDMKMIMAGLRSLDSVSGSHYYGQLMEKIKPGSSELISGSDSILIDLSSWNKDIVASRIALIQDAIEERRILSFDYYAPSGDTQREIEPYYLVFKWSSWYVYGFCRSRQDFRLFKLNRMGRLRDTEQTFLMREAPAPDLTGSRIFPRNIAVKAIIDPTAKWRLIEEYGPDCFEERPDGKLYFESFYTNMEGLLVWVLTFGDRIEILEPVELREKLLEMVTKIQNVYGENENE